VAAAATAATPADNKAILDLRCMGFLRMVP